MRCRGSLHRREGPQAANHALDKNLIIERILNGTATPLNGVMSPDAFTFNADLPEYAYDEERAKALLAEAGYPHGLDVTLDTEAQFRDLAEAIGSVLTKAGIRTTEWVARPRRHHGADAGHRRPRHEREGQARGIGQDR